MMDARAASDRVLQLSRRHCAFIILTLVNDRVNAFLGRQARPRRRVFETRGAVGEYYL